MVVDRRITARPKWPLNVRHHAEFVEETRDLVVLVAETGGVRACCGRRGTHGSPA